MSSKPPKRRGRPPKPKRRQHPNSTLTGPVLDSSLPPDDVPPPGEPDSCQGTALVGDEAHYALLAAQSSTRIPDGVVVGHASSHRLFLNAIAHKVGDGWRLVKQMPTETLASWFDDQLNDYHVHDMSPNQDVPSHSLAVVVKWIGHPGSSPRDPRARQFFVRWNDPPPPKTLVDQAIAAERPVLRWDLRCAGVHEFQFGDTASGDGKKSSSEAADSGSENDCDVSEKGEEGDDEEGGHKRWKECSTLVKLHVEVYANDLSSVSVWQQHEHPDVPHEDRARGLQFSRVQRTMFMENIRLHGLKVSSLIFETMRRPPAAYGRTIPLPPWREANRKELQSMYVAVKQRTLLDRNPWRATHLLVRANKDKIFKYVAHDFSRPDSESRFAIGLTDNYSLESGIAYTLDEGLGTDQCWRNKSQNRAAMSILCTVDESVHMVPVSLFISANAKSETLLAFLDGTREKIIEHARAIVADPEIISERNRTPEVIAKIKVNAETITLEGWCPKKIMIDKHYPSLRSIQAFCRKHNLTIYIRLCQFHVVRAILFWEWGDGRKGLSVRIPKSIKFQIVWLFRFIQRARTREEFDALAAKFLQSVEAVIMNTDGGEEEEEHDEDEDGAPKQKKGKAGARRGKPMSVEVRETMFEAVQKYFEVNWFVDDWIDTYTDIGLPPNQGRDGTWNTNNWTERAFKTFDSVILENRQNKRIDRLASHILNDFLPYYQYWRPADRQPAQEMLELHRSAYALWDRSAVRQLGPNQYAVETIVDGFPRMFVVTMNPMTCQCIGEIQSGKPCLHILTVRLLISNGPVELWMKVEAASEKAIPKRNSAEEKRRKVTSDYAEDQELYDIFEKLADAEEQETVSKSASPEPDFGLAEKQDKPEGFAAMGRTPGRPPNSTPLQPNRKTPQSSPSHEPKFTRKTGRPSLGRLAPNSLFPANVKTPKVSHRLEDLSGFLTAEELEMNTANVTRWGSKEYLLRAEEMEQWATILNYCEISQREGWLFVSCSPTCFAPAIIEALDWSKPISVAELRAQRLPTLADVFEQRSSIELNHLVCFHLFNLHWTIFHHNLTNDRPEIEWINPLRKPRKLPVSTNEAKLGFSIRDQAVLTSFLSPRRLQLLSLGVPSNKPKFFQTGFTQWYLQLQWSDSSTCGFWCVFATLSLLLGFDLEQQIVRDLDKDPADLKEVLAPIYSEFRGDELGVRVELVEQLFCRFSPAFDYSSLQRERFSMRPASVARAEAAINSAQSSVPAVSEISADAGLQRLINPLLGDVTWLVGEHRPSAANIRDLLNKQEMNDAVLDAYLYLLAQDTNSSPLPYPNFLIVDSLVGQHMQEATKNGSSAEGMAPKATKKGGAKFWFEQDIFLLDSLIIPWFWTSHCLVVGVDIKGKTISVYDSYQKSGGKSRAKAVTERTLQMLRWEHRARYNNRQLGDNWSALPNLLNVPQQGSTLNRGLYSTWFIERLVHGDSDVTLWSFTQEDCERQRLVVLNCLSAAIHADPQERNTQQLAHQREILEAEERVYFSVYPTLPSTDHARLPSLEEWLNEHRQRETLPHIGMCILVPPFVGDRAIPAIITEITDDEIRLDFFDGVYDDLLADRPPGLTLGLDQPHSWRDAGVNANYSAAQLARIKWPAHLTASPLFFPSPLFPAQQELFRTLEPLVSTIAALYLEPVDRPGTGVFSHLDTRFTSSDNPSGFYRQLLGTAPGQEPFSGGDEALFTFLCQQVRHLLQMPDTSPRPRGNLPWWINGAARSMFAIAAASHYLGTPGPP
ncbi:hypothetical protein B0H16DRAFT_1880520 [Mycena metata]|uniref:SWIM-type domain-containing protein n=1 Tax=Mycena metata TaxID=1033252 RepID=A0AAD7JZW7_9AGAR|nr:hypothetical protein B0H16DRAFT_1880520 [Mycena metata]